MLFLVKVKEEYTASSVYLIALDEKADATDPAKVRKAILSNGTTYQSHVDGQPNIIDIIDIEPHRDEEKELRERLKVIRDFKKKNAATAERSNPAPAPAPAPTPKKTTKKTSR